MSISWRFATFALVALVALVTAACGSSSNGHPDALMIAIDAPADAPPDARAGSSFDTAIDITSDLDSRYAATLASTSAKDYYKFTTATPGVRLDAITNTDANQKPTGTVTDTVLTIYDSSQVPIAQADNGWPDASTDSTLWFETRAPGTYYLTVEDCNSAYGVNCAPPATITDLSYTLEVNHTNRVQARETTASSAQDGTIANAQAIAYSVPTGNAAGDYGFYILDGNFSTATDTHVFAFTPPAATLQTGARERAEFWVQPMGAADGDGSTANIRAWVTAADGTTVLARADENNYGTGHTAPNGSLDLSLPVASGTTYYLFVQNTAATSSPTTDYYYVNHFVGSWFVHVAELEGATRTGANDTLATAEVLSHPSSIPTGYYVDGNLATASDVDWYEVDVPTGETYVYMPCYGSRQGAGITGMTATLYDATGTTAIAVVGPEVATQDGVQAVAVPTGTTKAYLEVRASGLDATDTGTAYRCAVYYLTP